MLRSGRAFGSLGIGELLTAKAGALLSGSIWAVLALSLLPLVANGCDCSAPLDAPYLGRRVHGRGI
jgi:hypothetical protein